MDEAQTKDVGDLLNKVPAITIIFWIVKILATTVGETVADVLSTTLKLGLVVTSYVMAGLLVIALFFQFRSKKYVPGIYWIVVVFISVVGTLISDNLVDNLGVSLLITTLIFGSALVVVLTWWYRSENTLSVHTIYTFRRELFYWAAILCTFSLGTSAGDLLAERLGVGYALSALIFASVIGLIAVAHRLGINGILAFWLAYIFTRPLGASIGDLLSQPAAAGGLGFGTVRPSVLFLLVIVGLVRYLTTQEERRVRAPVG